MYVMCVNCVFFIHLIHFTHSRKLAAEIVALTDDDVGSSSSSIERKSQDKQARQTRNENKPQEKQGNTQI